MQENPGVYHEARNRIREQKEKEQILVNTVEEHFEKNKEKIRSRKKLDVFELKRRIETGHSLEGLKSDIREAFREGDISAETFERVFSDIERKERASEELPQIDIRDIPFSQNTLAQWLENQPLGNNV